VRPVAIAAICCGWLAIPWDDLTALLRGAEATDTYRRQSVRRTTPEAMQLAHRTN
jgi:hypothetical protein